VLEADSVPTQATQFATITADLTAQATTSHEAVYFVDLRGAKRYGKVILTPTTNTNDSIITTATPDARPAGAGAEQHERRWSRRPTTS
jgi:hypothetical protein